MRVRRVDASGDMVFGGNQAAFWQDAPDGVAQVVESRLNLWEGQWYLDAAEGTPYQTQVLGKRTEATRDPVLRARILETPGVTEIAADSSTLNRETRALAVSATINTAYTASVLAAGLASTQATVSTSVYDGR